MLSTGIGSQLPKEIISAKFRWPILWGQNLQILIQGMSRIIKFAEAVVDLDEELLRCNWRAVVIPL